MSAVDEALKRIASMKFDEVCGSCSRESPTIDETGFCRGCRRPDEPDESVAPSGGHDG